jgi:hypothetical protein
MKGTSLLLSTLSALLISSSALASTETIQPVVVKLTVETKSPPKEVKGLILSTSGSSEISETQITKIGDKLFQVIFSIPSNQLHTDTVATAMITAEDGSIAFSNVSPALSADPSVSLALLDIKDCPAEQAKGVVNPSNIGALRQLVDIRTARADLAKMKLGRAFTDTFLAKLKKFEDAFGLTSDEPLSAELPAEVLVERLARLNYALSEYKMVRGGN